jgi:hypothetical protein
VHVRTAVMEVLRDWIRRKQAFGMQDNLTAREKTKLEEWND